MQNTLNLKKKILISFLASFLIVFAVSAYEVFGDITRTNLIDQSSPGNFTIDRSVDPYFICTYWNSKSGYFENPCDFSEYINSNKFELYWLFCLFIAIIPVITALQFAYEFLKKK